MRLLTLAILSMLCFGVLHAQTPDEEEYEDTQDSIRLNPDIVFGSGEDVIHVPSFIHKKANHINLNGADWSGISARLNDASGKPLTIVHIGDSHIQAEIGTNVTREMLQLRFGNAGRGLVAPLRLAGTNQPRDYKFESSGRWAAEKFMKAPWINPMGFTGTSITLHGTESDITLSTTINDEDDYDPFTRITLYHSGRMEIKSVSDASGMNVIFNVSSPGEGQTDIALWSPVESAKVSFTTSGRFTLFGALLSGERPGVMYHAIGNNGATYSTYNRIANMASGVAALRPDIIVLSLGTNEAFGSLDIPGLTRHVDTLVKDLRRACPDAQLLIVTPMECHRRMVRRVRRRRVTSYSVNPNILPIRNALLRYAADHNIAVYDWYEIAGGQGASDTWIAAELFGRDRVHHTSTGYRLHGRLLYEALEELLDPID